MPREYRFFPVALSLVCRFRSKSMEGCSVSMGSKLMTFDLAAPLPGLAIGSELELSLDWPALLDRQVPMTLWIDGSVRQLNGAQVECRILRYEFRTRRLLVNVNAA